MKSIVPSKPGKFLQTQLLTFILLIGAGLTSAMAQTYEYSVNKSGDWNNANTWKRREVGTQTWGSVAVGQQPSYTSGPITIPSGKTVTVSDNVIVDELTVEQGGTIIISYPKELTVNDGSNSNVDLKVDGTIIAYGRGGDTFGNLTKTVTTASIEFSATGIYRHEFQESTNSPGKTAWGVIPVATWDPASTIEINIAGAEMTTNNVPASSNFNQNFGNVKWNTPNLGNVNISMDSQLTNILGTFEVTSTGSSQLVLTPASSTNYTLNVGKDLKILNSSKVVFAAGTTGTGTFNLNIGNNLEIASTGYLHHSRASSPIKTTFTGTNATINTPAVINNMDFEIAQTANVTLLSDFAVPGGQTVPATLNILGRLNTGAYKLSGNGTLNLQDGAYLGIGSSIGLNGNVSVQNKNYSSLANFVYNGVYPQSTGSALPATLGGLVIENPNNVELSNAVTITKLLSLQAGTLNTLGKTLKLKEGTAIAVNSSNTSYVNGAVTYEATTVGNKSMLFPVGTAGQYRPLNLDLSQAAATTTTYTATLNNTKPTDRSFPTTIDRVSQIRYYNISRSGSLITNGIVKMSYNADDIAPQPAMLSIAKSVSNSSTWSDLDGSPSTDANGMKWVTSSVAFTEFSDFVLANKTGGINPLPVELISFKAEKAEKQVNLTWATATEKNNAYFMVERAADGKNFTAIGQVEGAGTASALHNYSFTDKLPLNNISYYRLKQVDFNGKTEYSQIVKVQFTNQNQVVSLSAFPNPTSDKVQVQFNGLTGNATLQLTDLTGRLVSEQIVPAATGSVELGLERYPAGMYNLKLTSPKGNAYLKVIKK